MRAMSFVLHDPPLVHAGRKYYWKQMVSYIDALAVPERTRESMKRIVRGSYGDAVAPEHVDGVRALEFDELRR